MTRDKAIAELIRIWHSPHLDLSLKAGLGEAIDALKGEDGDLISRQAALDAIMGEPTDAHYPPWYAQKIKLLPSADRPTGRWIDYSDEGYVECPFCHSATTCDGNKDELHFCFSCGARMRGEEE